MIASFEGHVATVILLVKAKAQVNIQREDGVTALSLAAQEGKVEVVRVLIEAKALVNIQKKTGA
jgi:ankyrin repeat protein